MATEKEILLRIKALLDGKGFDELKKRTAEAETGTFSLAGAFKGLLPALSVALVASALKAITDAAIESERSSRILTQTIKNLGLEGSVTADQVKDFASRMQQLAGITDEEVIDSFNSLVKVTKDAGKAFELVKLAIEMSSGSGKSLAETSQVLEMAILGNTRGLRQFGIQVGEGVTTVEALRKVMILYSGQTEKLSKTTEGTIRGAMQSFDELKETSGRTLLPVIGLLAKIVDVFLQIVEVGVKGAIISFTQYGNVAKAVFETIVNRDLKALSRAWDENVKLEGQRMKNMTDIYKKETKEKEKLEIDFSKLKDIHNAKDEKDAERREKEEDKRLKEKSKKVKDYWEFNADVAEKSTRLETNSEREALKAKKKILDEAIKDKRLQTEELDAIKRKSTLLEIELNQKLRDSARETAKDIAQAFMEGADNARFSWETTTQKIATKVISDGLTPMIEETKNAFGGFGEIGNLLLTGVGGAVGSIIGGFLGWGQQQTKSVAEYTEEAYDRMVEKTNDKLDDLGRKKSETGKAIELVQAIGKGMAEADVFGETAISQRIAAITGVNIAGMTKAQALQTLGGQLMTSTKQAYQVEASELAIYETPAAQRVLAWLSEAATRGVGMTSFVGRPDDEKEFIRNVLGLNPDDSRGWTFGADRSTGLVKLNNAGIGALNAALKRYSELKGLIGGAELDTIKDLLRIGEETGATPSFGTGGTVPGQLGQPVNITAHGGEVVSRPDPLSRTINSSTIMNFSEGAIVINGVNFANEAQKEAVGRELASIMSRYFQNGVRISNPGRKV